MGILLNRRLSILSKSKAFREALAISACLAGALIMRFFDVDIRHGVLPDFITKLPVFGHRGFLCPLCGGTRAFVMTSTLSVREAFHYSILGTCVSIWLLLTLPIRLLYCIVPKCVFLQKLYHLVTLAEKSDYLILMMAVFMWLQLYLHYCHDFFWIPLLQLT